MADFLNIGKLLREAIDDAARDYVYARPEIMVVGHWQIRLRRRAPWVPARTFMIDTEPGNPENVLDRWPLLRLWGEIIGEPCDPANVFAAPERRALQPLIRPDCTLTIPDHYRYLVADAQHAAQHRHWDPLAYPRRTVDLTQAPSLF